MSRGGIRTSRGLPRDKKFDFVHVFSGVELERLNVPHDLDGIFGYTDDEITLRARIHVDCPNLSC